jgi:Uma2 family endonuclease
MATAARIPKPLTFDEFCTLVPEAKADLIDGVIYMASPENTKNADIFTWLIGLMFDFAEYFDLGKIYGSRVACKLDEHNAPEPDILFLPKKWRKRILPGRIQGAPRVAVEIVSPDSIERDYYNKRRQYEKFGVDEYWIIDEKRRTATFLRLGHDGRYAEVTVRSGIYRSKAFPGFWLRLDWLWPDTRPLKRHALTELLRSMKKKRGTRDGK